MSDLISRSAAIDAMCELMRHWFGGDPKDEIREIKLELEKLPSAQPEKTQLSEEDATKDTTSDCISRQAAIEAITRNACNTQRIYEAIKGLPSAQSKEVIPHRNYKYLSDYWCECGWHLGKKGELKYCSECGRKVNWDG